MLVAAAAVVLVLVAGVVFWFVVRDSDDASGTPPTSKTNTTSEALLFELPGVPFTFQYPGNFAQGKAAAGFIWIAGISPVDIIDIRRVADREYAADGLGRVMRETLESQDGVTIIGNGTELVGGQPVVTYLVQSGTTTPLESKLVFFSRAGSTWQLECQSQAANRVAITTACTQVLSTLTFS